LSVDQLGIVDIISVNRETGRVVLTVCDHLDWLDSVRHRTILQEKFNRYLAFVESGEIFQRYPNSQGRSIVFKVVFKYSPDREGEKFLKRARQTVESAGFWLEY